MELNILVSTIDEGIHKVEQLLLPAQDGVSYIVSHQFTDEKHKLVPKVLIQRADVIISQLPGNGLSRNRNNAISLANGDIALIADDDIKYLPDSFEQIKQVFGKNPQLDVACFKIKTDDGAPEKQNYPLEPFVLKKHKHHYISSVEIAFRVQSVREKNIFFDERFGLGNELLPDAEELVFIKDCIRAGLITMFFPVYTVYHPFEPWLPGSSQYTPVRNRVRGAYHARVLGWKAIPVALLELFVRMPAIIKHGRNPLGFAIERFKAISYIFKTNHKCLKS